MKLFSPRIAAVGLVSLFLATSLLAQEQSLLIRTHRPISSVATSATASLPQTTAALEQTAPINETFPSLSPRQQADGAESSPVDSEEGRMTGPAITVTSSLAIVLGLFAAMIWLTRKFGSRSARQGSIPKEVVQILGTTTLDVKTQITMVRCGQRILILAKTNTGVHPLSEITNHDEVRELTAACLGDAKRAFASTLQSIETEQSEDGYLGTDTDASDARSHGRLFATA